MTRRLRFLSMAILLLGVLLMPTGRAMAEPRFTEFTGSETLDHIVYPGTWTTLPGGILHIRGVVAVLNEDYSDDSLDGPNTITLNRNLHPTPGGGMEGPQWGTWYLDNGSSGSWSGTWSGYWYEDGTNTVHVVGVGVGNFAGMHIQMDGVTGQYTGRIIETGKP